MKTEEKKKASHTKRSVCIRQSLPRKPTLYLIQLLQSQRNHGEVTFYPVLLLALSLFVDLNENEFTAEHGSSTSKHIWHIVRPVHVASKIILINGKHTFVTCKM